MGRIEQRSVFPFQVHSDPEIVQVIRPEHFDFFSPLRCFEDDADRKFVPSDAQQPFASLAEKVAQRPKQLR